MNYEILKDYKAKSNDESVYDHSENLLKILKQLKDIHNIDDNMYQSLNKCCWIHDIGKCSDNFQKVLSHESNNKTRHELISASYKDLTKDERIAILLHHKTLQDILVYGINKYYHLEREEVQDKLNEEFIDISKDIIMYDEELKTKNNMLLCGYLKLCDWTASANIDHIDIGFNAKNIYKFEKYKTVQQKVLDLSEPKDILILAPTGCGKTETSLLWSDKVQNDTNSKRIFFILPYIASLNALYKRLNKDDISCGILHSKVKSLLKNEGEDIYQELELFKKNIKQITVTTIFQILKSVFGSKNWDVLLAQFNNSIFIIDEIHCFAIREFTLIIETLRWLKINYNINICIMSASIPTVMRNIIQERLGINTLIQSDKEDYMIRHKIHRIYNDIFNIIDSICYYIDNNKKVLLCVNNVDTSQKLYLQLKGKYPDKTIKLIHGRFNAKDRTKIEQNIDNCDILIGTQAIEVSLDIDYDIMFTEIAPYDALIQRFGRVNRKGIKGLSDVFILNEFVNFSIYDKDIIKKTNNVISMVEKDHCGIIYEELNQKYLDLVYDEFNIDEYNTYKSSMDVIINNLKLGEYNENATDDMINSNENEVDAIPISLLNEYRDLINKKDYISANELFVKDKIYNCELIENDVYCTNREYNEYIGLI